MTDPVPSKERGSMEPQFLPSPKRYWLDAPKEEPRTCFVKDSDYAELRAITTRLQLERDLHRNEASSLRKALEKIAHPEQGLRPQDKEPFLKGFVPVDRRIAMEALESVSAPEPPAARPHVIAADADYLENMAETAGFSISTQNDLRDLADRIRLAAQPPRTVEATSGFGISAMWCAVCGSKEGDSHLVGCPYAGAHEPPVTPTSPIPFAGVSKGVNYEALANATYPERMYGGDVPEGFPCQAMEASTEPLTHMEILSAVHHHASEIVRLTAAVPVQCSAQPPPDESCDDGMRAMTHGPCNGQGCDSCDDGTVVVVWPPARAAQPPRDHS